MRFLPTVRKPADPIEADYRVLRETVSRQSSELELYENRIFNLELQLAEDGWQRLAEQNGREFTREAQRRILDLSRVMYLKNPLIKRGVEIAALYVWGQDLSVTAADPGVQTVIDRFWDDNRSVLTGQQASRLQEVELEVAGNVFWALFADRVSGQVRVRPVPMEEIQEIVSDPDDRFSPWYYRRVWAANANATPQTAYYPDWRYDPASKPAAIGDDEIRWDSPILHVKAGAFPHWRWGVSEVYAAVDWARAYKEALEDDATRSRALARFAWKMTTAGGKQGVAAAKSKLGTTYAGSSIGSLETNPPPLTGSTFIGSKDAVDMDPIRVAGATLDPDHSKPARQMASAALGIPDHFFDANQSNLATSKTLDRPTELRFNERRQMWRDVLTDLLQWVIDADLAAARGILPKTLSDDDREIQVNWASLLEPDIKARVDAIVAAVTLSGSQDAGTLPSKLTSRLLMTDLGVENVDEQLAELEAEQAEKEQKAADMAKQIAQQPPAPPAPPTDQPPTERARIAEVNTDGAMTLTDLMDVISWWDKANPKFAGLLNAQIVTPSSGGAS